MKLSIKNTFRNLVIAALGAVVLSACGGAGSCTTCSSNSTANTGSLDKLSMVAPSSYPAGVAATVPVVVTNNGTETINNLNYAIDPASNTTGGTITIQAASATSCRIIAAKASCTLNAEIAATPASHPGSFSVATSQGAAKSGISTFLASSVLSVNVNIGLVQMPTNTSSGADGLTLYYPSAIVGTTNGSTQVIVTAVVTSANAGSFNTIQLVDGNGNPLNYTILSGNSGTGMTNLAYGSVVSFLVTVPSGSSQVQFKAQTAANGTVTSTSTNSNTVVVTNPATPTGIMNVSPNYFNLTPNSESQIITLSNSGNGAISSLSFTPSLPLTELSNTCGTTLAAGATCQYVVKFNKDIPQSGTSGVTVNYNNGSTSQSATATVNYTGVDPIAGLTITSNNPDFDFTTRTNTPSQTSLVTLTNSGNSDETDFSFSPVTYFTTNTTGVVNPCSVSTILAPGASCNVNLVYNNSTAIGVTTDVIPVSYKYGQTAGSASSSIHVTYNTIQSVAILAITPNPTNFTGIVNNNVDNNLQTVTVANSGDETATLTSTTFSGSNAALFSVATSSSNPCGASLAANSSCNQDVQFGPTPAAAGSQIANLDINYIPYTSATAITTSASLTGQVSGAQSAIVASAQTSMSGFTSGDGTQFNSYQIAQGASAATVTYVITNTGTVPANSFYVSGVASSGWSYSGCGANGVPVILAANSGTCTLIFTLNTATAAARNLDLSTLTMNWVDQDTPAGQTQAMSGITYANVYLVTPVTILQTQPANNSIVQAASTSSIGVTFSENMNPATINSTNISLIQQGGGVTNLLSGCSGSGAVFSCNISSALMSNATYVLTITTGVSASSGDQLLSNYTSSFSTNGLIAGDGQVNTYYYTGNTLYLSVSGGSLTPVTYTSGSPSGNISLLQGNSLGRMYFATSNNQIWSNNNGGAFSLETVSGMNGNVTTLNGDGTYGDMYFSTSTNQVYGSHLGATFVQTTINGTLSGSIIQFVGDGVGYACFLTSTSQIWCGFYNTYNLFTLSAGTLSGDITNLVGVLNANSPINIQYFTSNSQLWIQNVPGETQFSLATYSGALNGSISSMGSDGNRNMYLSTSSGEIWKNNGTGAYTKVTTTGSVTGTVNLMVGNNGYMYFVTTTNQLWGNYNGGSFSLISVGYTGNISQVSGSGGYIYFVTSTNQVWENLNGGSFNQLQ